MANVSFDEEVRNASYGAALSTQGASGIPGLLIRWGFAKDTKGANMLMLIVAIISLVAAAALMYSVLVPKNTLTPEQQRNMEWMKQGNVGIPPASFMPELR